MSVLANIRNSSVVRTYNIKTLVVESKVGGKSIGYNFYFD